MTKHQGRRSRYRRVSKNMRKKRNVLRTANKIISCRCVLPSFKNRQLPTKNYLLFRECRHFQTVSSCTLQIIKWIKNSFIKFFQKRKKISPKKAQNVKSSLFENKREIMEKNSSIRGTSGKRNMKFSKETLTKMYEKKGPEHKN